MGFWDIAGSTEFAAALGGSGAAFLLEATRRRVADNSRSQLAINVALVSLSQMYAVLKMYHDQVFVRPAEQFAKEHGREPAPLEFRAAIGVADQDLRIKLDGLGELLSSHFPDILPRLLGAERIYLSARALIAEHAKLCAEMQRRVAERAPPGAVAAPIEQMRQIIGPDLFAQLEAVATMLQRDLPRDYERILEVNRMVFEVARKHFPVRRFVKIATTKDTAITDKTDLQKPIVWRRVVRASTDLVRGSRLAGWLLWVTAVLAAAAIAWFLVAASGAPVEIAV